MALDFEKLKAASADDLVTLVLCELSRFVDAHERLAAAIERIAPTDADLQVTPAAVPAPPAPTCPHPVELRVNAAVMGEESMSRFTCGLCRELVTPQPVGT